MTLVCVAGPGSRYYASAGESGSTVVITGSGFGTGSAQALWKQNFISTPNGGDWEDAGFEYRANNAPGLSSGNVIDMTTGIGNGGGSFRWSTETLGGEFFPHHGIYLPQLDQVYFSLWYRIGLLSGGNTGFFQTKAIRAGWRNGTTDPADMYSVTPRMATEIIFGTVGDQGEPNQEWWDSGGGSTENEAGSGPNPHSSDGNWHQLEIFWRWNDVGSANAIQQVRQDGHFYINKSNEQIRSSSSHTFEYIQPMPGVANDYVGRSWDIRFGPMICRGTRFGVALGNASTRAACTRRYPLDINLRQDARLECPLDGADIPSGFDWAYVTLDDGTENSSGYTYTVE